MSIFNNITKKANPVICALVAAASLSGSLVSTAQAEGYHAGFYAHVQNVAYWDRLNMRKWPASHSQKVSSIPDNGWGIWVERCKVFQYSSDWCKVKYAGKWGWVNSRYLQEYQY